MLRFELIIIHIDTIIYIIFECCLDRQLSIKCRSYCTLVDGWISDNKWYIGIKLKTIIPKPIYLVGT